MEREFQSIKTMYSAFLAPEAKSDYMLLQAFSVVMFGLHYCSVRCGR